MLTSRRCLSKTYPGYALRRLSVGDQNVDGITSRFRAPSLLDVSVEDLEQFGRGRLSSLPGRAGEPRQEYGGGSSALLNGQEQPSDLLEISIVPGQTITRSHTGHQEEDELEGRDLTRNPRECELPDSHHILP